MTVDGIHSSDFMSVYGENSSNDVSAGNMGYDDFLTLLIAQLKNQNPLEPLQSSEFTSQLAQFSAVEQLYGMNRVMLDIQNEIAAQGKQDLISLIGKNIKVDDNTVRLDNSGVLSGYYRLKDNGDVKVNIYDDAGWLIRSLYFEDQVAGEHGIDWDGLDNDGLPANEGVYHFEVTAKNENGASVGVDTYITGEVTGITYEYGDPCLLLGDRLVSANNTIVQVNQTLKTGS